MGIRKALLASIFFFITSAAHAGITEGKITYVFAYTGSDTFSFGVQSSSPNFASCAKQMLYVVSTATSQGKNIYSAVLAAKMSGQSIQIVGYGTCNMSPNSAEDVNYIALL